MKQCRICRARYDPVTCVLRGDKACCDECRRVLDIIRRRGLGESYGSRPSDIEERIARFRRRVEEGLPLFDEMQV